jgi:drug/metabolite transporter (DMT)-like permease
MRDALLAAAFVAIWASAFTAIRGVVPEWPPLWGLAVRFVLVAPLLWLVVLVRRAGLPARRDWWRLAVMGAFGSAGYLGSAWSAAQVLPTGLVAILSAAAPLFVALGEVTLLGKRMPALAWLGLALGWLGVAGLGLGRGASAGLGEVAGLALALFGALSQAIGILAFAPARGRLDAWTANAGQASTAAVVLLAAAVLTHPAPPPSPGAALLGTLAYSVLVVGMLGYALFFVMLQRFPAASAAALQLLAPPLAALLGWALLGETLAWTDLLGGAVTLAGLLLLFRARAGDRG